MEWDLDAKRSFKLASADLRRKLCSEWFTRYAAWSVLYHVCMQRGYKLGALKAGSDPSE